MQAQVNQLKNIVQGWRKIEKQFADLQELTGMVGDEDRENEFLVGDLEAEAGRTAGELDRFEFLVNLSAPNDTHDAILTVHAGAGGTESCDWAAMLIRMYRMWSDARKFSFETADIQPGEEAGVKSATFMVKGEYAYGLLKGEAGVHRLVRISPFDSNSRRHTSFASVDVIPDVGQDIDIQVSESDLKIDTYRAGGAGGQHVNKVSSAVRITHLPSGIVVQCQNERSQHKNKDMAMKVLKARLYDLEMKKRQAEKDAREKNKKDIAFGNQIRSYVFHPYSLVKDLRTDMQTSNVQAVMDGGIEDFLEAYLKKRHEFV